MLHFLWPIHDLRPKLTDNLNNLRKKVSLILSWSLTYIQRLNQSPFSTVPESAWGECSIKTYCEQYRRSNLRHREIFSNYSRSTNWSIRVDQSIASWNPRSKMVKRRPHSYWKWNHHIFWCYCSLHQHFANR